MSNLLDKASIILTPTAYNNGEALCVKPSDGSGDFDFSRNSAATRVNAQGLVENVQILSSNLVQNGDFSEEGSEEVSNGSFSQEGAQQISNGSFDTDTKWTTNTGWSISGGSANCDGTQSGNTTLVQQNGIKGAIIDFVVGKTYKVNFDVIVTSGHIANVEVASGYDSSFINSSGNHTTYITAVSTNDRFTITANPDFVGSIDNVSVREVGQDWSLGTGWSIGEDKAISDGTSSNLDQFNTFTSGTTYKVVYTIEDYISGDIRFRFTGASNENGTLRNSNGTYTEYIKLTNTQSVFRFIGSGVLSITNISVKEVGQNWDFGTGWEIGDNIANAVDAAFNSQIVYSDNVVASKKYKVSFNVSNYVKGSVRVNIGNVGSDTVSSNGNFTFVLTSANTAPLIIQTWAGGSGTSLSVTNISVIEITTDTSLPRINYEGFSYQDVLGSELVVNGTFDSDTAWSKGAGWSIANGEANANTLGSFVNLTQNNIFEIGKTYITKFTITNYTQGEVRLTQAGIDVSGSQNSVGTYEATFTSTSADGRCIMQGLNSFIGSIDNVSVKEYLGQEVVPDSGCGSWLFEPQSTNLVTYSEDFSNAYWIKSGASVVSGFSSPNGGLNAFKLVEGVGGTFHFTQTTPLTVSSGATVTHSIYAKKGERDWLVIGDSAVPNNYCWFDLLNGVIGSKQSGALSYSIELLSNGFYKCIATSTVPSTVSRPIFLTSTGDGINSYAGDGTSGIYIWGAQTEQQSYATSYIPTSGSTVTRNQDLCNNGGSLASINSTEGVLYFNTATLVNTQTTDTSITLTDGINNILIFRYRSTNQINLKVFVNGVAQTEKTYTLSDATDFNKIAIKWQLNNYKIYVNGVSVFTSGSALVFPNDSINSLSFTDGANNFFGKTKAVAVWKEALSDQELSELTTI